MSLATCALPSDPAALRGLAVALQVELARKEIEIAANAAELHAKTLHIEKLKMQLAVLRRARFGRSSEKLDRDIEQLELLIGELEADAAAQDACTDRSEPATRPDIRPSARAPARKPPVRTALPDHLPRETVTHEPACTCPGCGGTTFSRIGQDEREVLEYVPSSFKVIRHVRPKLSCRACETIVQAPMPSLPIERGRPGPGLIAHVLVAKYCDHQPLHRQAAIFAREGVEIGRATLAGWVGQAAFLLAPLAARRSAGISAPALSCMPMTPPCRCSRPATRTGRLWVVLRDERPWGSDVPPAALYHYSPDRKAIHAQALLGPCRGFLRADGYTGFDRLYRPATPGGEPPLIEVACWSHARRGFYDVHHATASPIALEALQRIAALFAIESSLRGRPPDQRAAARAEHAHPLLAQLKTFLDTSLPQVSGKSALAQAIRYALARWPALTRYVSDGRLDISNNAAERAMRPPVLGRKNYLFCGSDAGGQRAACAYTLIETCRMNDVDPQDYLTDILGRIADHPINKIDRLLPWHWKQ
ncbi:IS66 family transposase [Acidiphilium sp.]|jgi:transposase|uniref:IS66 family transposase n=1 Tax=Acidiphilium sp. TaxID=527 RepID=UPI00258F1D3F|nr:IS66 family transposase [Acidiphilium sp.]